MHWNYFNENDGMSGIKRYESELYNRLLKNTDIELSRIQRTARLVFMNDFYDADADIVHGTYQELAPLILTKSPRKFILTVHDLIPKLYFSWFKKLRHMWYFTEKMIQYAEKIIVDSHYTGMILVEMLNIDISKIEVIPLGVSEIYHEHCKTKSKNRIGIPKDKRYILINTSNQKWKNIDTLLKIVDMLQQHTFLKMGYGDNLYKDNVVNLGIVSEADMPYVYSACDLFVHTSEHEGFGLPVLEAMACGCPVVSSNATSLPEVIGNGGILVDTKDVDGYCHAIDMLMSNSEKYNEIKQYGIERSKTFTWQKTADMTYEVYKQCLAK